MVETSVKEIKSLVEQERANEEELQKARDEAANLVERAKNEAKKVMDETDGGRHYESRLEIELSKIAEKRKVVEKEFDVELEKLEKTAGLNMEKTVTFVVKQVLGE